MKHENAFVRAFIKPEKRRRYLEKLRQDRRWIADQLYDVRDLDQRYIAELSGPLGIPGRSDPYELLASKGAPATCYVVGDYARDGQEMQLVDAIDEVAGSGTNGTLISCVEGRLAYLQNEAGRFLLERPPPESVA